MTVNRKFVLQRRPTGLLAPGDLQLAESPVPELQDGQALAKVKYLSIDPTMRVWMAVDSYLPAVAIGEVMRSGGFAEIIESRHAQFKKGDKIVGLTGLQEYVVIDGSRNFPFQKVPSIPFVSDTLFLGVLGMTGLTAYFGMTEIAKPQKGETLVVSAAAGATGSVAGQIGKIHRLPRRRYRRHRRQMCLAHRRARLRRRHQLQASRLERKAGRRHAQRHRHRLRKRRRRNHGRSPQPHESPRPRRCSAV